MKPKELKVKVGYGHKRVIWVFRPVKKFGDDAVYLPFEREFAFIDSSWRGVSLHFEIIFVTKTLFRETVLNFVTILHFEF